MKRIIGLIWLVLLAAIPACATVSTETTRVAYTCNGVLTSYAYPFKVLADGDLLVVKKATATATSAETTLVLNTDYTVTGAGTSGGNVVLTAGSKCGSGYTLTILRNMAATQTTDYVDGEAFSAESLETALDKATLVLQQQKEQIGRAPKLPKTSTITDIALPNPTASNYIGWNAAATGLENKSGPVITTATQYEVDALISYGGGTSYTQATIEAALTAIGTSNKVTLLLRPGTWVISSNADWSAYTNVTFKIVPGAVISHGAFTVNIPNADAGLWQIFSGTGLVTISGNVKEAYPQWWGAFPNGAINCGPGITAAISSGVGRIYLSIGTWTLGTPIYFRPTAQNFILTGASRVLTDLTTLAVDISEGSGPNAMIVNQANLVNCIIEDIRFMGGPGWTGWNIWAEEGVKGGQAMFSSTLRSLWVSPGTGDPAGFFHGALQGSNIHDNEFELLKDCFNLVGVGNSVSYWKNNRMYNTTRSFIRSVGGDGHLVDGLQVQGYSQEPLIDVTGGDKWTITNIQHNFDNIDASNIVGQFLKFLNSTRMKVSHSYITRLSAGVGDVKGIYIDASEVDLNDIRIEGIKGYLYYPLYITGASTVNVDGMTVIGGVYKQIVTENASGTLNIKNSTFTKSQAVLMAHLGTESIDVTLENNHFLNSNYGAVGNTQLMFDYGTSGMFRLINNTIGVNDAASKPSSLFNFTGSGSLVMGGNSIIGLGGGTEFSVSSTQPVTYSGVNPGGLSRRTTVQNAPAAKTTATTLTIAELRTGILTATHTAGATVAYTLPTGTLTDAGVALAINESFDWVLINLSAAAVDTVTVTAGVDHTIVGNPIVQSAHATTGELYGNSSTWRTRKTAVNVYVTYRIN